MIARWSLLSLMVASAVLQPSSAVAEAPAHVRSSLDEIVGERNVTTTLGERKSNGEFKAN